MKKGNVFAAAAVLGIAGSAMASNLVPGVKINEVGSGMFLNAYDFGANDPAVFSNAFTGGIGNFSNTDLSAVHTHIQASGITTDGWITVIAAHVSTDGIASNGSESTALMFLIDDENASGPSSGGLDSSIGFSSTINRDLDNVGWINEASNDTVIDLTAGLPGQPNTIAGGQFNWNSGTRGDAWAWSGLDSGDNGSFSFSSLGGFAGFQGIQFLSWNEGTGSWSITEQMLAGDISSLTDGATFSFTVIPLPPAVLFGLAGLAGAGLLRRRMGT